MPKVCHTQAKRNERYNKKENETMENNYIEPLCKEEVKLLKIYRVLSTEKKSIIQDLITVWNSLYEQKNEEEEKRSDRK